MVHQEHVSFGWATRGGFLAAFGLVLAGATLPAAAEGGPSLGAARTFAALGGSTVTNTGPSAITGDVGVSPGSAIVGFPPGIVTGGSIHAGDATAAQAHGDASLAYEFLAGMASTPANNRSDTDLGGVTLTPGVWTFDAAAELTGALTLDAQGDSGALFVIQIGTTLTTSSGASVIVINGGADYDESCVFWQVGSSATLGSGTAFTGNILAHQSITLVLGTSMRGNALALNGAVTMDSNTVISPTTPGGGPPTGLDLQLGRCVVRDGSKAGKDRVSIKGSYSASTVPVDTDPRVNGVTIEVRAPGGLVVLSIPAGDPNWKASKGGIYRWRTRDGRRAPFSSILIDTRKSLLKLTSTRNEFGPVPVNPITVSLTMQSATDSDTRVWNSPVTMPGGANALFTLPR